MLLILGKSVAQDSVSELQNRHTYLDRCSLHNPNHVMCQEVGFRFGPVATELETQQQLAIICTVVVVSLLRET